MKELIEENYKSIKDRGLITPLTNMDDFIRKIDEEVNEFKEAVESGTLKEIGEELADVILTALNTGRHFGFNIENELKNKIEINKQRANETQKERT